MTAPLPDRTSDREDQLAEAVCRAVAATADERLRVILDSLVRHLHAFLREVHPSEREFEHGLRFVRSLGELSSAHRDETIIAADVLGLSSLVTLLNEAEAASAAALRRPMYRISRVVFGNAEYASYAARACVARPATAGEWWSPLISRGAGGAAETVIDISGEVHGAVPSPDGARWAFVGDMNPPKVQSHSRADIYFLREGEKAAPLTPGREFEIGSSVGGDQHDE